jgi:hypothetical protein
VTIYGETVFFDNASLLKQIGATIDVPAPSGSMKPATFELDDPPLVGHGTSFRSILRRRSHATAQ